MPRPTPHTATPNLTRGAAYTPAVTLPLATPTPPPTQPEDDPWAGWISASRTRNWIKGDPLMDWLDKWGREKGFEPDDEGADYDPRTNFRDFLFEQGHRFEAGVVQLLRAQIPDMIRIGEGPADSRDAEKAAATIEAMKRGVPVIEQAVLHDHEQRTYGVADLLVRSDYLNLIVPETIAEEEAHLPAPGIGAVDFHYRVVDIKFSTLDLKRDGTAGAKHAAYAAQVWIYTEALSRTLGMTPLASYLLGRSWIQGKDRGDSCLDRLGRVDHFGWTGADGAQLATATMQAVAWLRRVATEGSNWEALPRPSVPELYPDAGNDQDAPWHEAKKRIMAELAELTLIPGVNPESRRKAHAIGIYRWTDPRATAATLGVTRTPYRTDAILHINRDDPGALVLPERIGISEPDWRTPAKLEFFVDFEWVGNIGDDFSHLPRVGGQVLIFQVGYGLAVDGEWQFRQQTVRRLNEADEREMIDAWLADMRREMDARGLTWTDVRLIHWSPAETSSFDRAYNSARERHPERNWPELPWFDLLSLVIRPEPVTVTGAFGFGLKAIANGMHRAGLIETTWTDGPADGMGAMIGAWWCDAQAAETGVRLDEIELMQEIGKYNEVDCRSMAEVLGWLRANR